MMSELSRIFFYGLFMDLDLLREKGLHPSPVGRVRLPGYQIYVGNRASLIPSAAAASYGMLVDIPEDEASELYSAPDVRDYRPEIVSTVLLDDGSIEPAQCYILPPNELDEGANTEYAKRLASLVLALGFPPSYASEITQPRGS